MIYNEIYVGTAVDVCSLIELLTDASIPRDATTEIAGSEESSIVEVWYDKSTNTVILK